MIILRQKQYTSPLYKLKAKLGRKRTNIADKLQSRLNKIVDEYDLNYVTSKSLPGVNDKKLLISTNKVCKD